MASPHSFWQRLLDLRQRQHIRSLAGHGSAGDLTRDDRFTIAHFSRLLSRHGQSHRSLEWRSQEAQQRRFAVLAEIGLRDRHTVLDVGCGTGDLVHWMLHHDLTPRDYLGLDITPAMVEAARARFPEHRFLRGCPLTDPDLLDDRYDWVLASGIFAHRYEDPEAYMHRMIGAMLERATLGVAVNSLSSKAPNAAQWTMFHANPEATLAWARTVAPVAVLREDYDPHDFTLYLYQSEEAAQGMMQGTLWQP